MIPTPPVNEYVLHAVTYGWSARQYFHKVVDQTFIAPQILPMNCWDKEFEPL